MFNLKYLSRQFAYETWFSVLPFIPLIPDITSIRPTRLSLPPDLQSIIPQTPKWTDPHTCSIMQVRRKKCESVFYLFSVFVKVFSFLWAFGDSTIRQYSTYLNLKFIHLSFYYIACDVLVVLMLKLFDCILLAFNFACF